MKTATGGIGGAVVGFLLGGPIGAVIGAAGGAFLAKQSEPVAMPPEGTMQPINPEWEALHAPDRAYDPYDPGTW